MIRISSMSEEKNPGVIRFRARPSSLGVWADVDGRRWDIGAIGNGWVSAMPVEQLPEALTSTATWTPRSYTAKWRGYIVEVVGATP